MAKPPIFVEANLLPAEQLELQVAVANWKDAQQKVSEAVAAEMELRLMIVNRWFKDCEEGTNTGSLKEANLKCGIRINRSVSQDQFKEAWEWATKQWESPHTQVRANSLRELLETTFKPKYELSISA